MFSEHLALFEKIDTKGVEVWNSWRAHNPDVTPQLEGAQVIHSFNAREYYDRFGSIDGPEMAVAMRDGSVGRDPYWSGGWSLAFLGGIDLRKSNLRGATLVMTSLQNADLSDADLRGADFRHSNLSGARFVSAKLHNAMFGGTTLNDTDLSGAEGLESCRHWEPSHIDRRSLVRSGRISPEFLRGCGLSDLEIEIARLLGADLERGGIAPIASEIARLAAAPTRLYSCFISHSTKDQAFAEQLHRDLQNQGIRCWFAPHDIRGGRKIHEQVYEAILSHDRLLLILSEESMRSDWVNTEIAAARQREINERKRLLYPIRLVDFETIRDWKSFDADTGRDSAREIREYFIPDFSNWTDASAYRAALTRLVHDLKVDDQS